MIRRAGVTGRSVPRPWRSAPAPDAGELRHGRGTKYIVVDMFARAVQGDTPEAAVAGAENEMKHVYT